MGNARQHFLRHLVTLVGDIKIDVVNTVQSQNTFVVFARSEGELEPRELDQINGRTSKSQTRAEISTSGLDLPHTNE